MFGIEPCVARMAELHEPSNIRWFQASIYSDQEWDTAIHGGCEMLVSIFIRMSFSYLNDEK